MADVFSMLVPLETLPGWPVADEPSVLEQLLLLVGIPALAFLVVVGIAKLGKIRRVNDVEVTDPVWVGGHEDRPITKTADDHADIAAGGRTDDPDLGGAGARW